MTWLVGCLDCENFTSFTTEDRARRAYERDVKFEMANKSEDDNHHLVLQKQIVTYETVEEYP